jgi:hypothetical protein
MQIHDKGCYAYGENLVYVNIARAETQTLIW